MADESLQTQQQGALQRPSFIEESMVGTEGITSEDLRLPRLAIAQGLSTQLIPSDASYIPGLSMFDLFNDLTGEIYGKNKLTFIVCQRDVKRMEFDPDNRGVPLDLDVPAGDPRMKWGKDEQGKGVPPRATKFVEFVLLLVKDGKAPEPIVLSIKETNKFNKRAHERLTGFIAMRQPPAPIYAGLYTVHSGSEKNDKGTFGTYVINNAGWVADKDLYKLGKTFHQSLKGKKIIVQREPGDETEFDTSTLENSEM